MPFQTITQQTKGSPLGIVLSGGKRRGKGARVVNSSRINRWGFVNREIQRRSQHRWWVGEGRASRRGQRKDGGYFLPSTFFFFFVIDVICNIILYFYFTSAVEKRYDPSVNHCNSQRLLSNASQGADYFQWSMDVVMLENSPLHIVLKCRQRHKKNVDEQD